MIREWLTALLRHDTPVWPFPDDVSYESLFNAANSEGVIGLLNERVNEANQNSEIPSSFKEQIASLARAKALQSLMREAECRRIIAGLQQAGIEALLLKGSALAYWAYPSAHLRECSDIDILLRSHDETKKAIRVLQDMQYSLRDPALAGDLVSFEHTCIRDVNGGNGGLEIDLHWRLSSSPIFAFQFDFDELNASAIALTKLGDHALGLSAVHAFFNACMHRLQNMADVTEDTLKWLYDIHLLSQKFTPEDWQLLANTAIERKLAGTCHSGLRATILAFNTAVPADVLSLLGNAVSRENIDVKKMGRWFYIQRMSFLAFPEWRMSLRWLRQRLLPDRDYLQSRYGGSRNIFSLTLRRIWAGLQRIGRHR